MKKILLILSIVLLTALFYGCEKQTDEFVAVSKPIAKEELSEWDKIVQRNELKVGVPTTADTFDNALIDAFAAELEIAVTKVIVPRDADALTKIQDGTVDMLWGQLPATSDTSTAFRLSTPYFNSTILYLTKDQDFVLDKTSVVGVMTDSAEEISVTNYYDTVYSYSTENELFYALNSGICDVILYNKALYENNSRKSDSLHIIKEVPYELVVAFEQNNVATCTEVEKILAKIKANGRASEICLDWYPVDLITK
ncbi:MAG: amino acid ABC transporter substrate-binding protein [Ruminococcaceae bacterium]|nr:amino acid ABC transporter substrate-binding protein [Oscillospiraceae bacterium]